MKKAKRRVSGNREPIRHRQPGYATELLDYPDGSLVYKAHDLDLLADAFGESLLWGLARCFEACDRLMSLSFLVPSNYLARVNPVKAERNRFTAFWLSAGTMRELALAVLELPRMERRLTTDDARRDWLTLRGIAKRWNSEDYVRVRNAIGFHLDSHRELFRRGMQDLRAEAGESGAEPLILARGDSPRHGHSAFPFGREIFVRGLWPKPGEFPTRKKLVDAREAEFKSLAGALARDQTRVGALLQGLLVELLREGRAVTVQGRGAHHRARLLALLKRRQDSLA